MFEMFLVVRDALVAVVLGFSGVQVQAAPAAGSPSVTFDAALGVRLLGAEDPAGARYGFELRLPLPRHPQLPAGVN
jgi:uncharacterized membrane protein YtjA (UPF0391 family)